MIDFLESFAIMLMIISFVCSAMSVVMVLGISKYVKVQDETRQIALEQVKDIPIGEKELEADRKKKEAEEKAKAEAKERELELAARKNLARQFKWCGVLHSKNYRFTWYSSKVLYHYRTPEWTTDESDIYRDKDGYVVIASYSHKMGTVIDTPFGDGKVYDKCGVAGTIDIYVNW